MDYLDIILFAVNFAFNLLICGLLITVALIFSLRSVKTAAPRLRYFIVVTAFLIAAVFPLIATFNGSFLQASALIKKPAEMTPCCLQNPAVQNPVMEQGSISTATAPEAEFSINNIINSFTLMVASSRGGIIIFVFWMSGAAYFLLRDGLSYRKLRKACQAWQSATSAERTELHCPPETRLYFDETESPGTYGFFYPVMVLPKRFPNDLSLAAKRYIVRHEAAHARWRDPLVNSMIRLVRSLFWVSPGLWWLESIAAQEREAAADDEAIFNSLNNRSEFEEISLKYASTLLSVARHFNSFSKSGYIASHGTGLGSGSRSRLESRIHRLLISRSKPKPTQIFLAFMILLGSLPGLALLPAASFSQKLSGQTETSIFDNQDEKRQSKMTFLTKPETTIAQSQIIQMTDSRKKISLNSSRHSLNEPYSLNLDAGGNSKNVLMHKNDEDVQMSRITEQSNQLSSENGFFVDQDVNRPKIEIETKSTSLKPISPVFNIHPNININHNININQNPNPDQHININTVRNSE